MTFVVVGDAMLDVTVRLDRRIDGLAIGSDTPSAISAQAGGSAANVARWLAWTGKATWFAGAIGDDSAAAEIRSALEDSGAHLATVTIPGIPTGTCVTLVEPGGERTMLPDRGANARLIEVLPAVRGLLGPDTHLHLPGYSILAEGTRAAAAEILSTATAAGASTSVDCSSAAPLAEHLDAFCDVLRDCGDGLDVLLANADEATVLGGAERMLDLAHIAVVKRGADDAEALTRGGEQAHRPALPLEVMIDATGAGDAFAAGFLPAWRSGRSLADALDAGHRIASLACGRVGAGPPAP